MVYSYGYPFLALLSAHQCLYSDSISGHHTESLLSFPADLSESISQFLFSYRADLCLWWMHTAMFRISSQTIPAVQGLPDGQISGAHTILFLSSFLSVLPLQWPSLIQSAANSILCSSICYLIPVPDCALFHQAYAYFQFSRALESSQAYTRNVGKADSVYPGVSTFP